MRGPTWTASIGAATAAGRETAEQPPEIFEVHPAGPTSSVPVVTGVAVTGIVATGAVATGIVVIGVMAIGATVTGVTEIGRARVTGRMATTVDTTADTAGTAATATATVDGPVTVGTAAMGATAAAPYP